MFLKILYIRLLLPAALMFAVSCFGADRTEDGPGWRFFRELGPGWNLGNAFDSYNNENPVEPQQTETLWGNPRVGRELFKKIYEAGFRVVRIPVTWSSHLDERDVVNPEWMERIARVVTEALDNGLLVIINAHHENWYSPFEDNAAVAEAKLRSLWKQIAWRFSDFDKRLIFEGMNEPRLIGTEMEWTCGTPSARAIINDLNRAFVETVRESSPGNAKRFLLVTPYAAIPHPDSLDDFVVPGDDRVGVSLHVYIPLDFVFVKEKPVVRWDETDPYPLPGIFKGLRERYASRGIPVVITEYGAVDKDNEPERIKWVRSVKELADASKIPIIWWDNGKHEDRATTHTFSLLDRHTLTWCFPDLIRAMTAP